MTARSRGEWVSILKSLESDKTTANLNLDSDKLSDENDNARSDEIESYLKEVFVKSE